MAGWKPLIGALVTVIIALTAALGVEQVYHVSVQPRSTDLLAPRAVGTETSSPLALRLVDSGGVGIPMTAAWGTDYSHDRRTFRDVIHEAPPYVDAAAFQRVEADWHAYVERMREYGNNAMAVPLLLELIDFDGTPIYEPGSAFRARHEALRRYFGSLFDWTDQHGMQIFLDTDMLTVTPPLARYLRRVAPDTRAHAGIDPTNPAVWEVYRAGLDELFTRMPNVKGLIIRFGEGGNLYNTEGWPYRSEMTIRTAAGLRAMLRGLLPLFKARGKTLVLRSWTVGVGPLGRLHIDPDIYRSVLGDIDSPALVISTKYTAGDFFSYLPLNPTLAAGRQRRIIELQAKPEFEGFSAFPDFLGAEHARALRVLRAMNPHIAGTYVLTQYGGPLRAGPRTLYPLHGFWLWTDANVFVASSLAAHPDANVFNLTRQWAERQFGHDPRIVNAVATAMTDTREAVLEGFYIRPFAEQQVHVPGIDVPPLMWIFEWNMVGGWHALLSLVYRASRDHVDTAIAEGHHAVAVVRRARQQLQSAFAAAGPDACGQPQLCAEILRSLEYQETLLDALAAWRQAFLSYYRWIDSGDPAAWQGWVEGKAQFEIATASHLARFGNDPLFPAFDFTSARRVETMAEWGGSIRRLAGALMVIPVLLLMLLPRAGAVRLARTAALTPWRLTREPIDLRAAIVITCVTLVLIAALAGMFTGFSSAWIAIGAAIVIAVMAVTFETVAMPVPVPVPESADAPRRRGLLLVVSIGSLLPFIIILFAVIAYLGPVGAWYAFWMTPAIRIFLLTIVIAMMLWPPAVTLAACSSCSTSAMNGWPIILSASLAAAGVGLLTLTALLPDWVHVLKSLDRPLNIAPATDTMLFALRTYAGVTLDMAHRSQVLGTLLLALGVLIRVMTMWVARWRETTRSLPRPVQSR